MFIKKGLSSELMGILSCLDAYRAGHEEEQLGCYRAEIYNFACFEVHWTADDLKGMCHEMDRVGLNSPP
jgi:hypothetical protein